MEKIIQIPVEEIRPFGGDYGIGYFRVRPEKVEELAESIRWMGILSPLIVRPDKSGVAKYELISGKTRLTAAKEIGLAKVPCVVRDLDDRAALALYGESNRYRDDITITEKAFMCRYEDEFKEAEKCKTDPRVRNANLDGDEAKKCKSDLQVRNAVFDETEERQRRRYIRLTYLTLGMRDLVDARKISIKAGCEASYLPYEMQDEIVYAMNGRQLVLTQEAVERMRSVYENQRKPYGKMLTAREVAAMIEGAQPKKEGKTHVAVSKRLLRSLPPEYQSRRAYEKLVENLLKNFSEKM